MSNRGNVAFSLLGKMCLMWIQIEVSISYNIEIYNEITFH